MSDIIQSDLIKIDHRSLVKMAKNGLKMAFVGTLKLCQKIPDIIQSDLIKFDNQSLVKMAEKWPENGLLGPKMAIFAVSTK